MVMVMAGLVPTIHVFERVKTWIPGTSPEMTGRADSLKSDHLRSASQMPPSTRNRPRAW